MSESSRPASPTPGTAPSGGGLLLIVDDEPRIRAALAQILRDEGSAVAGVGRVEAAVVRLRDPALDVVLLDLVLGPESGIALLERIKRERPEVEVVVMTGHASVDSAVGCMRRGAFDYLRKPFEDIHRVRATVRRAFERRRLLERNRALEREVAARSGSAEPEAPEAAEPLALSLDAYERRALERALEECEGDASEAARRLGIGRSTLYRKLARHGLRAGRAASAGVGRPGAMQ